MASERHNLSRYDRQMVFPSLGLEGQRSLLSKTVLIVGAGGLGSWLAELLTRAGVGRLHLVDDDRVQANNLHRQTMYDEIDVEQNTPKVDAAARRLRRINSQVEIVPHLDRIGPDNIEQYATGVDLILDGADNFAARFLVNDYCVKVGRPWVFAGVVGAEAQTMTIIPGRTPCLRCICDSPPPPCVDPSCRIAGVLGPAVGAVASIEAMEAVKILSGHEDAVSPYLLKLDFWTNEVQRIDVRRAAAGVDCLCCKQRKFEYLEA